MNFGQSPVAVVKIDGFIRIPAGSVALFNSVSDYLQHLVLSLSFVELLQRWYFLQVKTAVREIKTLIAEREI